MNNLIMPFIIQDENFVLGFECGQLWELISQGACFDFYPVHTKNIEQIKLICLTFGVTPTISNINEGWCFLTIKQTKI